MTIKQLVVGVLLIVLVYGSLLYLGYRHSQPPAADAPAPDPAAVQYQHQRDSLQQVLVSIQQQLVKSTDSVRYWKHRTFVADSLRARHTRTYVHQQATYRAQYLASPDSARLRYLSERFHLPAAEYRR